MEATITDHGCQPPALHAHQLVWLKLQREASYSVVEPSLAIYFNCLSALWATGLAPAGQLANA